MTMALLDRLPHHCHILELAAEARTTARVDRWPSRRTADGYPRFIALPHQAAIRRQTAHAAKSSPLQEQLQGLLLAEVGPKYW